jgi:hypothetical protein
MTKPHLCKPFSAEVFKLKANQIHNNKFDYSKVVDAKYSAYLKVEIGCPIHGFFFQEAGNHLLNGTGCKQCGQVLSNNKLKKKLDVNDFIIKSKDLFGENTFDYSLVVEDCYLNSRPIVNLICKKHGKFSVNAKDHLGKQGSRCKTCSKKESYGEFLIRRELEQQSITFVQQKTFNWCINPETNRNLYFDFYLIDLNLLIEFDGEYHFIPPTFGIRNHDIENIKMKDKIKTDSAEENGIKLYRIHFKDRNPIAIKNILTNILRK